MEVQPDLAAWLDLADQDLAKQNVPVSDRIILSIHRLVQWKAIMDENGDPYPLDPARLVKNDWFFPLAKMVGGWYRSRYAGATKIVPDGPLKTFVLIRFTPFVVEIPKHRTELGEEAETAWMHLSDKVRDDEHPVDWIVRPPELNSLVPKARTALEADLLRVADALRFIYIATISVPTAGQDELLSLLRAIVPHLNQAAEMIGQSKTQTLLMSYWELQMAAESAVKAFLLRKTGRYSKSHDFPKLTKEALLADPTFPSRTLATFPNQQRVINMRYGIGAPPPWETCFTDYCAILEFIRASLHRLPRIGIGSASFLLKTPSWI